APTSRDPLGNQLPLRQYTLSQLTARRQE
ncbi:hypothetical protein D049_1553B, partial [Vibrio parahaemolyticus VPTS-2010]